MIDPVVGVEVPDEELLGKENSEGGESEEEVSSWDAAMLKCLVEGNVVTGELSWISVEVLLARVCLEFLFTF